MKHLHQKAGGSRMPPTAETVAKRLHYVHQEGAAVYKFAVARMAEVATELMRRNKLTSRHGRLAGAASGQQAHHRSDRRAHGAAAGAGDGDDPQIRQHHSGNDPAVPVGIRKKLKAGDRLMLAAFGGGFTWGGIYLDLGLRLRAERYFSFARGK